MNAATNPDKCRLPISQHFPPEVRDSLVAAAGTPNDFDPMARAKAIDRAATRARAKYPELFRPFTATQE